MAKKQGLVTDEIRGLIEEVAQKTASLAYIDGAGSTNYFKATERLLFNYKRLAVLVRDYEAYTAIELHSKSKSLVAFTPGASYKTREEIMDDMQRDKEIAYHRTLARFEEIDRVIRLFENKREFCVIRMYYFGEDADGNERPKDIQAYTWQEIAFELSERGMIRDEKSARRWRNKIVNDIAVCLFGKHAAVSAGTYRKNQA